MPSEGVCAAAEAHIRSCGLLGPGQAPCDEPETQAEECTMGCFVGASCADLREAICGSDDEPTGAFATCLSTCQQQGFRCDDGQIVSRRAECDGVSECDDNSDEARCGFSFTCNDGAVLPGFLVCDGFSQCNGGEDEADCFFECGSGDFVPKEFKCDGDSDCVDGSDELGCPREAEPICN